MNSRYYVELLTNGLYYMFDRHCQWGGVFNADGTFRHGSTGIRNLKDIGFQVAKPV